MSSPEQYSKVVKKLIKEITGQKYVVKMGTDSQLA